MTLALSPSPLSLANLIVSDIAPTRSSLSPAFRRYVDVMTRIADPTSNIRTREEADSALKAEEKVCHLFFSVVVTARNDEFLGFERP